MWGGRYAAGPAEIMERINASIDFDQRLYAQDIAGSKAHCRMLVEQDIIAAADGSAAETETATNGEADADAGSMLLLLLMVPPPPPPPLPLLPLVLLH